MYHSKDLVARIQPDAQSLTVSTPVISGIPKPRPSQAFTGAEYYNSVFATSLAERIDQRIECFRLRYQVYCIDNEYEDPDDNPDGLETDAYDSHSVHSLLVHRSTGQNIGTVRLVLSHDGGERRMLPMQRIAGAVAADDAAPFPILSTAEISRFSIVKSFRQVNPENGFEATLSQEEWRKTLFHLPLGLFKSLVEMSAREGITHWAAVMEPTLLRLLTRFGIHFTPLGALVNYHGRRQPVWVEIDTMLSRIFDERPDVWEVITDGGRLWPLTELRPVAATARPVANLPARRALAG